MGQAPQHTWAGGQPREALGSRNHALPWMESWGSSKDLKACTISIWNDLGVLGPHLEVYGADSCRLYLCLCSGATPGIGLECWRSNLDWLVQGHHPPCCTMTPIQSALIFVPLLFPTSPGGVLKELDEEFNWVIQSPLCRGPEKAAGKGSGGGAGMFY